MNTLDDTSGGPRTSLRDAIAIVDNSTDANSIDFSKTLFADGQPKTISLNSALPSFGRLGGP